MEKKKIERREVKGETITGNREIKAPEPKRVELPEPEQKPKKENNNMGLLTRIASTRVGRAVSSVLGGVLGFSGGALAGLDIEFALLVAVAGIIACFKGVEKALKFFEGINDSRNKKSE